jgi:hypothetical protein
MANNVLVSNGQLRQYLDCKRDQVIVSWLNKHNVAWWADPKGKPCTTEEAINKALIENEKIADLI